MDPQHSPVETAVRPDLPLPATLHGCWLASARTAWVAMVSLAVALFVVGLPASYQALSTLSVFNDVDRGVARANLAQLGLPGDFYAVYQTGLGVVLAAVCFAFAAIIFWRKSDQPIALFVALVLVLLGATFPTSVNGALGNLHPFWEGLANILMSFSVGSVFIFFYLFSDGRFVPRWTRWLAILCVAWLVSTSLFPDWPYNPNNWPDPAYALFFLGWLLTGVFAQVYRYRRVSGPVERQQTKWVFFGFAAALSGYTGIISLYVFFPSFEPGSLADIFVYAALYCFMLLIPLSIGLAILHYRLWDIDLVINRTLVYGALTASVVGLYVLVVGGIGTLLQAPDLATSLLAAGLVAVLFEPLRNRLQRGVNHLMYGERDEPYKVISRLGQRLEATLAPEGVFPTIVETVAQALKLPYAAIALKEGDRFTIAAAHGVSICEPAVLPLVYQREEIGRLILSPRRPNEQFTSPDRRLLEDLARQAEVAVYAVRLTADLQRSREQLVMAREEERRRLRRDLHDGLGPTLAGLALSQNAVRKLVVHNKPQEAEGKLARLEQQTEDTVAEVRRLIHGLRPPALDDLGLIPAIRQLAQSQGMVISPIDTKADEHRQNGPVFSMEDSESLPALPAAVEVATFRIAQEALTNVASHARADSCRVCLSVDESARALELEVADDGAGILEDRVAGVGLSSMRERAEELGGTLVVGSGPQGGTRMFARLPLHVPEKEPRG